MGKQNCKKVFLHIFLKHLKHRYLKKIMFSLTPTVLLCSETDREDHWSAQWFSFISKFSERDVTDHQWRINTVIIKS